MTATNGTNGTKPLPNIDIKADAKRVFEVLTQGGLAIIPADIGYAIIATEPTALERAFVTKQRKPHKRHAMVGSYALHQRLHELPEREAGMVKLLCNDLDIPLGVIAPLRMNDPIIQKLGQETLARSSVDGTLAMLVNGGKLQEEISRLATEADLPLMGSSANMTGKGTKSLVEEIEPEIIAAADIIIDYGKRKYSVPRTSTTMINFKNMELIRFGACYDVVRYTMQRYYGIEYPEDPGKEALFSGHRGEQATQY
jgi:tRNA A37 threonylcarbamoyladenosine synthetase subunit TsaC/SUA5/YrdC